MRAAAGGPGYNLYCGHGSPRTKLVAVGPRRWGRCEGKDSFLLAIQSSDLLYGTPATNYCPIGNSADLLPAYLGQLMPIRELGCNSARRQLIRPEKQSDPDSMRQLTRQANSVSYSRDAAALPRAPRACARDLGQHALEARDLGARTARANLTSLVTIFAFSCVSLDTARRWTTGNADTRCNPRPPWIV
jgi:hypothetical protein